MNFDVPGLLRSDQSSHIRRSPICSAGIVTLCLRRSSEVLHGFIFPPLLRFYIFWRGSGALRVPCFFSCLQIPQFFSACRSEAGRPRHESGATRGRQIVVGSTRTVPAARTLVL